MYSNFNSFKRNFEQNVTLERNWSQSTWEDSAFRVVISLIPKSQNRYNKKKKFGNKLRAKLIGSNTVPAITLIKLVMKFQKKNRKINQRTFRNKPNPPKMVNRIIASINRKIETNFFFQMMISETWNAKIFWFLHYLV